MKSIIDNGMTLYLDGIFSEFEDVFIGRKEDIKKFLKKYETKILKGKRVLNVERIDSTEKIKLSGFRENISSWLNPDKNPIISTCVIVDGIKKRYDYIFFLERESLEFELKGEIGNDPSTILDVPDVPDAPILEDIPELLKKEDIEKPNLLEEMEKIYADSFKLQHSFKFEQAIIQLDTMIELLVAKDLPDYVEKLEEKRNNLVAAREFYNERQQELEEIDQRISKILEESQSMNKKTQFQENINNINAVINELKEKDFPEYLEKLEAKRQEIFAAQDEYDRMQQEIEEPKESLELTAIDEEKLKTLKNLERAIKINREFHQFEAAMVNIEKMISILKDLNRKDLAKRYETELEEIKEKYHYFEDVL